ncbi:hypothetical protein L873DRAFT_1768447 [Choiromyces venosus 120613-1]|uniref:Uncharacterized protein n=1 Tax=Choiromyces venosus 120613-1 TaxID=1336337 RepID=A0A3N4JZ75_9PEZI|nr:hypothetical protein L873DRAFT_1768447 [Choiromyces venosus 120613-1]
MFQQSWKRHQELWDQFLQLEDQVLTVQDQIFSMMLFNISESNPAPLHYLSGIPINNLPATCHQLTTFTEPRLQVTAEVLGLSALSGKTLVDQRRAQITQRHVIVYSGSLV